MARAGLNFIANKRGAVLLRTNKRLRVTVTVRSGGLTFGVKRLTLKRPRTT